MLNTSETSGDCEQIALVNGPSPVPDAQIQGTAGVDATHDLDKIRMDKEFPAVIDLTYWKSATAAPPAKVLVSKPSIRAYTV